MQGSLVVVVRVLLLRVGPEPFHHLLVAPAIELPEPSLPTAHFSEFPIVAAGSRSPPMCPGLPSWWPRLSGGSRGSRLKWLAPWTVWGVAQRRRGRRRIRLGFLLELLGHAHCDRHCLSFLTAAPSEFETVSVDQCGRHVLGRVLHAKLGEGTKQHRSRGSSLSVFFLCSQPEDGRRALARISRTTSNLRTGWPVPSPRDVPLGRAIPVAGGRLREQELLPSRPSGNEGESARSRSDHRLGSQERVKDGHAAPAAQQTCHDIRQHNTHWQHRHAVPRRSLPKASPHQRPCTFASWARGPVAWAPRSPTWSEAIALNSPGFLKTSRECRGSPGITTFKTKLLLHKSLKNS